MELRKILIIDDDPDYRELTKLRLERAGYCVDQAENGQKALEFLEQNEAPHLIILDIEMPDKNGLTTLIHLSAKKKAKAPELQKHVPVLIATGLQSDRVKGLIMGQPVDGYLKKPYDSDELIQKVRELIKSS